MAITIRLKNAVVEIIRESLTARTFTAKDAKIVDEFLTELARVEEFGSKKAKRSGLPVKDAIAAFKGVLGPRLALPPNPDGAWWAIQSRALSSAGLTEEHCRTIATVAGARWNGTIKVDSLFRQGVALLAQSEETPQEVGPGRPYAPLGMEKV